MAAPVVHHVGIGVLDEAPTLNLFQDKLGFALISRRDTTFDRKWVLQRNSVTILITRLNSSISKDKGDSCNDDDMTDGCMTNHSIHSHSE